MKRHFLAIAALALLTCGATAQSIHPPTKEGAGATPGSPGVSSEGARRPSGANRPETQGGADSQQNRDYGKDTVPEGKPLPEGLPAAPKP